jgi:hypothetical protein
MGVNYEREEIQTGLKVRALRKRGRKITCTLEEDLPQQAVPTVVSEAEGKTKLTSYAINILTFLLL